MYTEFENKVLDFIEISQKNFNRLENKINNLESEISGMKSKINDMETAIGNLTIRMDNLTDEMNSRFETISSSVTLIENKVMTEFPALFEAFELHLEMHKDYDEKNSYLSAKVEKDSIRISVLEDQMRFMKNN